MAAETAALSAACRRRAPQEPDWPYHCAEFAASQLPFDVWEDLGGCPRSWRDAAALYRRLGVRCLADAATAVLGPPVNPKQAMRGDVVMAGGALGVCRGELAEFVDQMLPMRRATLAWRVDRHG